jgi:queuine tRNA-ribosyltransferase
MFTVRTRDPGSRARTGTLHLSHGDVRTPAFVPLATKGTVKTLEPRDVAALGYELILGNTFHLMLAPGPELVAELGGLHEFMRWDRPIITDSGGFQVFSMGHGGVADEIKGRGRGGGAGVSGVSGVAGAAGAAGDRDRDRATTGAILSISEEGVRFRSYVDGRDRFLSPETSMSVQAALGSDIALVFDECTPFHVSREYTERSMERTHRWLDRCRLVKPCTESSRAGWIGICGGCRSRPSRRARVTGWRSADRSGKTRLRCTRWCPGPRPTWGGSRPTGPAICWGSATSTT